MLRTTPIDEKLHFHYVVREGCALLPLSDDRLAKAFGISCTSVERWKMGFNTPHAQAQRQVIEFLCAETDAALRALTTGTA